MRFFSGDAGAGAGRRFGDVVSACRVRTCTVIWTSGWVWRSTRSRRRSMWTRGGSNGTWWPVLESWWCSPDEEPVFWLVTDHVGNDGRSNVGSRALPTWRPWRSLPRARGIRTKRTRTVEWQALAGGARGACHAGAGQQGSESAGWFGGGEAGTSRGRWCSSTVASLAPMEAGLRNVALVLVASVGRVLAAGGAGGMAALQAGFAAGDADGEGSRLDVDGRRRPAAADSGDG